ncbi:MAG TPA: hypothetical protein VIF09_21595, partial [Polyangiaceae bacterium]
MIMRSDVRAEELSRAVVVFLGFGRMSWPHRDEAAIVREFGAERAASLLAQVESLLTDLGSLPVDWSVQSLASGGDAARTELRHRHPQL